MFVSGWVFIYLWFFLFPFSFFFLPLFLFFFWCALNVNFHVYYTCTCTCIHVYSCSNAENSGKSNIHTKAKFNRVMYLLLHLELPAHVVQPVLDHIHKLLVVDVVVVGHAQVLLLPLLPALLTLHLLQTVTVKRVSVL